MRKQDEQEFEQELVRIGAAIELPKALERVAELRKILGETTPVPVKAALTPTKKVAPGWNDDNRRAASLRMKRMWVAVKKSGRNKLTKLTKLKKAS